MTAPKFESPGAAVHAFRDGLQRIGYSDSLLHQDYVFGDPNSAGLTRQISLAAFGTEPPSYRTACMGLAVLDTVNEGSLHPYRALGAPQLFAFGKKDRQLSRWVIRAEGPPEHLEDIPANEVLPRFLKACDIWAPAAVLRLKSAEGALVLRQLDFFDIGLLPALENEVHSRLHMLLGDIVSQARDAWFHARTPTEAEAGALCRLVFRLLAAKLLIDRKNPLIDSVDTTSESPSALLEVVDRWYYDGDSRVRRRLPPSRIQELVWRKIRDGLRLQNLSVEALAFVYENTMVSRRQRRIHGTHATPWRIAEYMINALPVEVLPKDRQSIVEPFSGHAPFMLAAMNRLKILHPELDVEERHAYLVRMLLGIEIDPFAAEVARYSLMLADYPASNGWRIDEGDFFRSPSIRKGMEHSSIILSNPPFEDFHDSPSRTSGVHPNKAVAALEAFIRLNPQMLGVILPQVFIDGRSYDGLRKKLAHQYEHTQVLWLPDTVFAHAHIEVAILLASRDEPTVWKGRVRAKISQDAYKNFESGILPPLSPVVAVGAATDPIWSPPLAEVWKELHGHPTLSDELEDAGRGIEYVFSARDYPERVQSPTPKQYFKRGVFTSAGEGFLPFWIADSERVYLNCQKNSQKGGAFRKPWAAPKVLVNAHRKSLGMWPLIAAPDREGLVAYQLVTALWPRSLSVEVLSAILNGPIANAYIALHNAKRDIRLSTLKSIPLPRLSVRQIQTITQLVGEYIEIVHRIHRHESNHEQTARVGDIEEIIRLIDSHVLDGYQLSGRLQRTLLLSFQGERRPGYSWWQGYYHERNPPAIAWSVYNSQQYKDSTARKVREKMPLIRDPEIVTVLDHLSEVSS